MAAPPPYASVLEDTAGMYTAPTAPHVDDASNGTSHARPGPPSQFEIEVTDPVKHESSSLGVSAYVTYRVRTHTTHPSFQSSSEVVRRYSHFSWLAQKLAERHKGIIIPPLPEKSAVQKFQMSTEFIDTRRRALQVFLARVAAHPVLCDSPELRVFLEAREDEFAIEMGRWQAEAAATRPPAVTGALAWFRGLQHSAQNLVAGRSDDALEDAEYIKVRDYISHLEGHLAEAHRQAARLVKKEGDLAAALAEFGHAAEQLGKFDGTSMRAAFDALNTRAEQIAQASKARAEEMAVSFEAPLKELARTIKSVQAVIADRAAALSQYCQAKSDLDSKKVKLAKLRGTPGLKEEKLTEAEREVTDGESKLRSTKIAYEDIAARMTEELNRFQKERAAEMGTLLRDFALAQARHSADNARAWATLLADVQQQQQQQQQPRSEVPAAS